MDFGYVGKLMLSVAIFAPGLILLVVGLFFGGLMLLEKWGVLGGKAETTETEAVNPAPGEIVADLKREVTAEAEGEVELLEKRKADKRS